MNHKRSRYQHGSLTIEKRSNGAPVWVYRWRESDPTGAQTRRKRVIGTKAEFPSKTAAMREVDALRLDINAESSAIGGGKKMSVQQLADHYRLIELSDEASRTHRTKEVYKQHLDQHILPRWGSTCLGDVKAFAVERWLKSLEYAPATKAKIKNVFSVLYAHGMDYGWAGSNPIRDVRQSAKRVREPDFLEVPELTRLFDELSEPSRTIAILAAGTGLRRSELFGLKWNDIDFHRKEIRIIRSIVDQIAGQPKTLASLKPLPLHDDLAVVLCKWRGLSSYAKNTDWLFASPDANGERPYWPSVIMDRHIKPAAKRAGITKNVGWHTFRRGFASLLIGFGADVKTAQELMRHASPTTTTGIYAQAMTEHKRAAQGLVVAMFNLNSPITSSGDAA